jgi:alkanesulfonate monooxygenase SsuD/methylene tetrahydromethanopterin reductase-like flavin-dependent oxidoreductase (luciferase family)
MSDVHLGLFVPLTPAGRSAVHDRVLSAEAAGFDYVALMDHPYVPDSLEIVALLGYLAAATTRISFVSNVFNLPLRPAAMLAKSAATIDILSGGRLAVGLGAGAQWDRIDSLGGPRLSPAEAFQAVAEAVEVMRGIWGTAASVTAGGRFHRLHNAAPGPRPTQPVNLLIGGAGNRMLDLTGRRADGWIAPIATPYESKAAAQHRISGAAVAAGRDPRDVRRIIQVVGSIVDRGFTVAAPRRGPGNQPVRATADGWIAIIAELVRDHGYDAVNLILETHTEEQVRRFGTDVLPAARAVLAE